MTTCWGEAKLELVVASEKGTGTLLSLPSDARKYFWADNPDCWSAIAKLSALVSELNIPAWIAGWLLIFVAKAPGETVRTFCNVAASLLATKITNRADAG